MTTSDNNRNTEKAPQAPSFACSDSAEPTLGIAGENIEPTLIADAEVVAPASIAANEGAEPTLLTTDWNAEWMELQKARRSPDSPAFWDAKAKEFRPAETKPYAHEFMDLLQLHPGESVLDMGCGAGSLALPLAEQGHQVVAADFSPAMLESLKQGIAYCGVEDLVEPKLLAWDDDWQERGMAENSVDVAFASRSIATLNLQDALQKLDATARRRCAITLVANASPRYDMHIMNSIGASVTQSRDYIYAFNILIAMGRLPEVRYIHSPRQDTFDSLEEGVADFARMLEGGNEGKVDQLREYLAAHMEENPDAGKPGPKGKPQGRYKLDHTRMVHWAFISWDTTE